MSMPVMSPEAIEEANSTLEGKTPQQILRWAVAEYHPHLMMATAFGAEGCCLMHMLAEIEPGVRIINLDTGYQFAETLELRERIKDRYGIAVEMIQPDLNVADYEREHGGPLYVHRPDQCCHDRKVIPLKRSIGDAKAWISAIRGDQTGDRKASKIVMWDAKFGLVKVNPLLGWDRNQVWKFVLAQDVPVNPLHDQGYPSIGCWPCTAPVGAHETDERAGRWAGTAKKECGLHVIEHKDGSGI